MLKRSIVVLAVSLAFATALPVSAQQIDLPASASTRAVELTTAQRSEIAQSIISRWMGHVLKSPGGDVKAWSAKLRTVIATADSTNLITASTMPSLDLIHAALVGAAIDDAAVKAALSGTASTSAPQALGSEIADTTYTPLPGGRCRIASSLAINFPLPLGVTRGIDVEDVETYAAQGGVGSLTGDGSANCGIPPMVTALALSVSSRNPTSNGVLKVFANNRPNSVGNTILFSTAAGGGGSDLIVESCQTCGTELSILATAQTGYIIDVLGYFMPPQATELQCTNTAATSRVLAPFEGAEVIAPLCPSGYAFTSMNCNSGSYEANITGAGNGICSIKNFGSTATTSSVSTYCCRVPGR